jgi:hypothetical protein
LVKLPEVPNYGTLIFQENFDSVPEGTWIGDMPAWTPRYNAVSDPANWIVKAAVSASAPHSLQTYGAHGGCWAGHADHAISGEHLLLRAKINSGGESGTGCTQDNWEMSVGFQNAAAMTWGYPIAGCGVSPASGLCCGGNVGGAGCPVPSYSEAINRWFDIAIEVSYSEAVARYWVDGIYVGFHDIDPLVAATEISLSNGDGIGWGDDVRLYDLSCSGIYCATANAEAATYGSTSLTGSGVINEFILIIIPLGVVILLRIRRSRR